ncbi:multidrug efflux system outer membrane protein [Herbaspirillum sp. Sphag1AN]|uniref:efflux transporter outer membrane subunit n=1 Tax=unclassified Herbaspirillum TaxID=2624150 RepID=UPI0016074DE7|nr:MULTISPECIES: efflux transporter outer membrane subunit [unclassified Herbaspirillum]MBB3212181.1 multidrug efflux system outer membrane protein [Herbaspirillum sp. Sphag1AN]MBB3243985.1 multidrug efflux system outer membrane protein [Herbaspirillum sp. Sphag64]
MRSRSPLAVALSAVLLLLTACQSMAPAYQRPAAPVAAQYPGQGATQEGSAAATALPAWPDYFRDPQLQQLIRQALTNNRDLRVAVLHVAEARAAYGISRADLFPTIGAQASDDRSRTPADLSLTTKPLLGSAYQVGLGLSSWEIDFWGRVRSLSDVALATYLATDAASRATRLSLITQVAEAYLELAETDERIAIAQQTIASRQESFRIFSRRVAVGSTSRLNLTQIETLLTQAQALGVQLEQQREQQRNALTLLVGGQVAWMPEQDRQILNTALPALQPGLPSSLLNARPDVLAAEQQLLAANANIGAARAAFFPNISLTASYGSASAELSGLFRDGSQAWTFVPSISLPLFNAGRLRNNLNLAEVRRDIAVASYEKTVQSAFRDVADALAARRWLAQQLEIAQTTVRVQRERARLSQLRYDNGASPFLDVLDAQRDLLTAEQQLVQTRRALLSSSVSLYAALGGDSGTAVTTSSTHSPSQDE